MATRIAAINAHRPRIKLGESVRKGELVRYIAERTGLNESEVSAVLAELRDSVIFFNRTGRGVKLEGLGTYLPSVGLDGELTIDYRQDTALKNGLNTGGTFTGTIENNHNIGKTAEDLVKLWNKDHADDPVSV